MVKPSNDDMVEQGRAIARGMHAENEQKQKNMAKAGKRKQTMLENAATQALSGEGVKFSAPAHNY
jgi:hypothetical protein